MVDETFECPNSMNYIYASIYGYNVINFNSSMIDTYYNI